MITFDEFLKTFREMEANGHYHGGIHLSDFDLAVQFELGQLLETGTREVIAGALILQVAADTGEETTLDMILESAERVAEAGLGYVLEVSGNG